MSRAKTESCQRIHTGRVFALDAETITLPNGITTRLDVIRHPGAAAIVAMTADREVLLLEQYRHAVGGYIWEIPAGTLEAGEEALACAQRELTEETGYRAATFDPLGVITPLPAYSDERIHLFVATDLEKAAQQLDEDELLRVETVGLDKALAMVASGRIQDAKTMVALQLAARRLG